MPTMEQAASQFLAKQRIAVTGVSRTAKNHGATTVLNRLRDRGYDVFAVNPNADHVEGARSYHDLESIPGGVDAVVIATAPHNAEGTRSECDELGIQHVWMHRSYGWGSVDDAATTYWARARRGRSCERARRPAPGTIAQAAEIIRSFEHRTRGLVSTDLERITPI